MAKIMMAQLNSTVGDLEGNTNKAIEYIEKAKKEKVDIVVFPEMFLTGYPIGDLVYSNEFLSACHNKIMKIEKYTENIVVIIGAVWLERSSNNNSAYEPKRANVAEVLYNKKRYASVKKTLLPNYDVFDEKRYFVPNDKDDINPVRITLPSGENVRLGIEICEDLWDDDYDIKVTDLLYKRGADIIINISASPFCVEKREQRADLIEKQMRNKNIPFLYVNLVGGHDELVFDGHSCALFPVIENNNTKFLRFRGFQEDCAIINFDFKKNVLVDYRFIGEADETFLRMMDNNDEMVINAHILNLKDYIEKTKIFNGVVLGLSGGLDSAYVAYIAAKAVGPKNVLGVALPTRFTSQESLGLAEELAKNLGINYVVFPIDNIFEASLTTYKNIYGETDFGLAEENDQSRIRMMVLMKLSQKLGYLVCNTGNKSELSVGYFTMYGDGAGGKNIPGDVYKTDLYKICRYINEIENDVIPKRIIERPPTAELRDGQQDTDSLPEYEILDDILKCFVDYNMGIYETRDKIGSKYWAQIKKVWELYASSEYKRSQMPKGVKVSRRAFGAGRRMPIINLWKPTS